MDYVELCEVYEELESTTKRLEKTKILSDFLRKVKASELEEIMLLLQGVVFPLWSEHKLGFSSNYIIKTLSVAAGVSINQVNDVWRETGDLGKCAAKLMKKKKQNTLFSEKLTVKKVFDTIRKLAVLEGKGSVDFKVKKVAELLSGANELEAKFVVKTVLDEMRIGLGEGTVRDAVIWAFLPNVIGINADCDTKSKDVFNISSVDELDVKKLSKFKFVDAENDKVARDVYNWLVEKVQYALDLCNDIGNVAVVLKEKGLVGLDYIKLKSGVPLKVMLGPKVENVTEAFEVVGKPAAIEHKLDGFRVQVHKNKDEILLFTRRLENVTAQFPDVVKLVNECVDGDSFILDCEAVGVDKNGFVPFQKISQRIKRKYGVDEMAKELPVELHVFDVLYHNNKNYITENFSERRSLLKKIVREKKGLKLVKQLVTDNEKKAEEFYKNALKLGLEGVMFKKIDAAYQPGRRMGYMVKMKPTMETLDLVIVGAEWGEGKRSGWLSSYIVACRDDGELKTIGRVSTGLKETTKVGSLDDSESELSFEDMTVKLKPLIIKQEGKEVLVKPKIVLEVKFEEIQKSPSYGSGFALRFPRIVRLREDRDEGDCSEMDDVLRLFKRRVFYHSI